MAMVSNSANTFLAALINPNNKHLYAQGGEQQRAMSGGHNVDLNSMYYDQSSFYQPYPGSGPFNQFNSPNMFNNSELVPGFPASIYTGLWSL
jgi:hypothetical protein